MKQRLFEVTGLRRKDVLIIAASVLIGTTLVGINFLHYTAIQHQYSISYSDDPDLLTIGQDDPFVTSFNLAKPRQMQQVTVSITFQEIDENTEITPIINNNRYDPRTRLTGGSTHAIAVEPEDLRRVNKIEIRGEFGFTPTAEIRSVSVSGTTGTQRTIFLILNILGILIIIGPILVMKYIQYAHTGELEEQFPNFLRDVVEGTRAGMPLPQAIRNTSNNNYGRLTPHVDELSAKLEWGIPFEHAASNFSRNTQSKTIIRSVNTIIQTYESGGNISAVLDAVGNNLKEIRKLQKERESQIYGEMITGYIIYIVFLFVLVVLIQYFLPALTFGGNIGAIETGGLSSAQLIATYRSVFRFLIIVQSIFSGLVIGRLSEGQLKAGAKHVGILLGVGYTVAAVFM